MFCQHCGKETPDASSECPQCGKLPSQPPVNIQPFLIPAIISTICCCLPFGIVAVVYASRVSILLRAGDISGAREASSQAKKWTFVALSVGFLIYLISAGFQILAFLLQAMRIE